MRPFMGARASTAALFFATGTVFGSWAGRLPAVKEQLGLSDGALAVALLSLEAGAVLGLPAGGRLVSRWGSRAVLGWSMPLFAVLFVGVGAAPTLAVLVAGTAMMAAANSVVDVAMNAQGLALQVRSGQPVMSQLHAAHPVGGVLGAGLGSLAAAFGVGVLPHFAVVGAGIVAVASAAVRRLVADRAPAEETPRRAMVWSTPLLLVGALAFCLNFAEGGASNWAAVHLRESLGASPGTAGMAVTVFLVAMAFGRLFGDRLVRRYGRTAVFRLAAIVGGLGLGAGLLTESVAGGLAGFALLGIGLSVTMPLTISAAGEVNAGTAAQAVATVSTMAYLGSFVAPPVIGSVSTAVDLGIALLVPAVLLLLLVPVAGVLRPSGPRRSRRRPRGPAGRSPRRPPAWSLLGRPTRRPAGGPPPRSR